MDALLTQRHVAQTIVDEEGAYVMIVKENQPQLRADIELVFTLPPAGDRQATARTVDIGHGRIEQRNVTTVRRWWATVIGPAWRRSLRWDVTSSSEKRGRNAQKWSMGSPVCPRAATPGRVLDLVRGHWHVENKSHWVRDVTFDEDRSQVRCGSIPQVMAALRNTAIGLLRWAGHTNIAAACRRLAAQPAQALALIGIILEN